MSSFIVDDRVIFDIVSYASQNKEKMFTEADLEQKFPEIASRFHEIEDLDYWVLILQEANYKSVYWRDYDPFKVPKLKYQGSSDRMKSLSSPELESFIYNLVIFYQYQALDHKSWIDSLAHEFINQIFYVIAANTYEKVEAWGDYYK